MNSINIGVKIKELREDERLTQKQLAEKISVNPTIISKWELDKKRPIYEDLVKLAKYFDVTTDYLLDCDKK